MLEINHTKNMCDLVDVIKIEEQKLVVTQANALARSVQEMTLQEKRLMLLAISQIRQGDEDFKMYRIPITTIRDYLDIETKDVYKRTEEITTKLMGRVLHIDDENGHWEKFQWVSYCKYIPKKDDIKGEACIEMQIHEHLRPMLLNLTKHFGSVPLLQIAPMPSVNSIRVFEILWFTSMRLIKTKLSFWLDDFKKRMGLGKKYSNFKDFRRLLDKAKIDCAEYSPLTFNWEEERKGRKIVRLHFDLQGNEKFSEPPNIPFLEQETSAPEKKQNDEKPIISDEPMYVIDASSPEMTIYDLLQDCGVSQKESKKLVEQYSKERIEKNVFLVMDKHHAGKVEKGVLASWTVKAILEDWAAQNARLSPLEERDEAEKRAIKVERERREAKFQKRKAIEDRFNEERQRAREELFENVTGRLDLSRDEEDFFEEKIKGDIRLENKYRYEKFESVEMKALFRVFLGERYLSPEFRDLETWCEVNGIDLEK